MISRGEEYNEDDQETREEAKIEYEMNEDEMLEKEMHDYLQRQKLHRQSSNIKPIKQKKTLKKTQEL